MDRTRSILTLAAQAFLLYVLILAAEHLYEPSRSFQLPGPLWFTHLILLYIHEAGHLLFSVFGRTMNILGGSLLQVLAPAVWYVTALSEGSRLRFTALFFTGLSLMDVSIYMKDAAMLQLPLIGGLSSTHHDWKNLFEQWDLINESGMLGEMVFWSGLLLALTGVGFAVVAAVQEFRTVAKS